MYAPVVELTQRLVGTSSVSIEGNYKITAYLVDILKDAGFRVEVHKREAEMINLIARKSGNNGQGLALLGHTDTVTYEGKGWTTDPLGGEIREGRVYGRGSADMKGAIAAMIIAAKQFPEEAFARPLVLYLTDTEEQGHLGAKWLLEQGKFDKNETPYAIVGEPTELKPIRIHNGIGETDVYVYGSGGHGSRTREGVNAIEKAHVVISRLKELARILEREHVHPNFSDDVYVSLNPGIIEGGSAKNIIAEAVKISYQHRPLPGMEPGYVHRQIYEALRELIARDDKLWVWVKPLRDDPGFETPADSRIIKTLEELTGANAGAVKFSTEAVELSQAGVQPVVLGPGSIEVAHKANEFVGIDQLLKAVDIYTAAIKEFCIKK